MPDAVKVPVTLFENVIDVPEITVILVPLGNFGCDANMPTANPAADATVPVAVPVVIVSVVETCVMFDAEPPALSRPTATYARFGIPKVLVPSPTPYGANTSGVVADAVAAAESVTWVALSTDNTTVLAGMPVPLTGIPGEIGVLPPFVVSDKPVTTAVELRTPDC